MKELTMEGIKAAQELLNAQWDDFMAMSAEEWAKLNDSFTMNSAVANNVVFTQACVMTKRTGYEALPQPKTWEEWEKAFGDKWVLFSELHCDEPVYLVRKVGNEVWWKTTGDRVGEITTPRSFPPDFLPGYEIVDVEADGEQVAQAPGLCTCDLFTVLMATGCRCGGK